MIKFLQKKIRVLGRYSIILILYYLRHLKLKFNELAKLANEVRYKGLKCNVY